MFCAIPHISVKGWIIDPYKYCLFNCSCRIPVFPSHYSKFVDVDIMTWGVTVVKYWWRGFWCSLNLSAKVLPDSPMYSSPHPCSLHWYLYMTPLLLLMESLSLGAMRRLLMVCPPLKCTCIPYLLHVFWTVSLRPWWYGTTLYRLVLLGPFSLFILLCFVLLEFWLFSITLFMAQMGYLHFLSALNRCCSSSCNSVVSEHMVFALWYRVPATLYLDGILWWLSHCRYRSVWVCFLNTDVFKLQSSAGVIRISRNGIDPSSFISSQVNFILGCMEFSCCRKLFLFSFLIIVKVSSTNLHIFGGVLNVLIALISRSSMNKLATTGLMGDPIAAPSFCS